MRIRAVRRARSSGTWREVDSCAGRLGGELESCAHAWARMAARGAEHHPADLAQQTAGIVCRKYIGVVRDPRRYKPIDEFRITRATGGGGANAEAGLCVKATLASPLPKARRASSFSGMMYASFSVNGAEFRVRS